MASFSKLITGYALCTRDSESLYEYDLEGSILFLFLKPDVFVYLGEDYPSVFGVYDDTAESIPDNFDFRKSGQRISDMSIGEHNDTVQAEFITVCRTDPRSVAPIVGHRASEHWTPRRP